MIKSATLAEIASMRERGELAPVREDAPSFDMPEGLWDDARIVIRNP